MWILCENCSSCVFSYMLDRFLMRKEHCGNENSCSPPTQEAFFPKTMRINYANRSFQEGASMKQRKLKKTTPIPIPGASLVPSWCLLGASLVPPIPCDLVPGPVFQSQIWMFCVLKLTWPLHVPSKATQELQILPLKPPLCDFRAIFVRCLLFFWFLLHARSMFSAEKALPKWKFIFPANPGSIFSQSHEN